MTILFYELVGQDPARPFSPHCWKTAFSLAHKGLAFKRIPTRFHEILQVEEGASKSVPVIRDGERVVRDSFAIALYLEESYPDRPSLFAGEGGKAMARFVERWTQPTLTAFIGQAALLDIFAMLGAEEQAYFRKSREERFGMPLEEVPVGREDKLEAFRASLAPLRTLLRHQPFIGGEGPLFPDHIVAGTLQWARVASPFPFLESNDPVAEWFERCLDLYDGLGRRVAAA
ncbi:glutathione S-transferase family protein [Chelativorans sp. YIM 93263]|uniref:glutathione S-transferase family protein n=1 Tax=Chelativorans sp. YIM 93263 TaxID=2906648 RepID=UPI002378562F|nr:glutathione S-transferase family protein [Chelativorans sp. YIM 93263]